MFHFQVSITSVLDQGMPVPHDTPALHPPPMLRNRSQGGGLLRARWEAGLLSRAPAELQSCWQVAYPSLTLHTWLWVPCSPEAIGRLGRLIWTHKHMYASRRLSHADFQLQGACLLKIIAISLKKTLGLTASPMSLQLLAETNSCSWSSSGFRGDTADLGKATIKRYQVVHWWRFISGL